MLEYIIIFTIYLILLAISYFYDQKILIGLSGLAFLYPITIETNAIIILLSVIALLFHAIIGFFQKEESDI